MLHSNLYRAFAVLLIFGLSTLTYAEQLKPRMLVLTDISTWETDDHESLIRLLAHADMFEIEGIVISTGYSVSTLNKSPESGFIDLARGAVDAYEKDLPNLMRRSGQAGHVHDGNKQAIGYWPSPDYLRKRIMFGSMNRGKRFIGDGNGSPGCELLIKQADEEDDRPLWIGIWGGGNTLAQAIYEVKKERSMDDYKTFLRKLRAYAITDQDRSYRGEGHDVSSHGWIYEQTGDDLMFIWDEAAWKQHNGVGKSNWDEYAKHIQDHGHLGSQYPKYKFGVEGDTPAFLYLMPNGLNDPEDPTQSSWGGNFVKKEGGLWREAGSCAANFKQTYPAAFSNFAARMDWAKDGKGNLNPQLVLNGDSGLSVLSLSPDPGTSVTLDASSTTDPDGDDLSFKWWVQDDAGSFQGDVELSGSDTSQVTVNVPAASAGQSFHVICEATDNGTHNLSSYRRVVFKPTGKATSSTPSEQEAHATTDVSKSESFADWLKSYIPTKYSGTEVVAHGGGAWFQAKLAEPELIASWAEWKEETLSLKDVEAHGLTEGESIFVGKTAKTDWADHANVTFYDGVGYYIDGYESSTMSGWDVAKSTIIQFTGDSDEFVVTMAQDNEGVTATSSESPKNDASAKSKLADWLRSYIPAKYSGTEVVAHGGGAWFQAKLAEPELIASWAEWKEETLSLKDVEAHGLTEGESIFVGKTAKTDWADHANVTFYDGVGYYIDGYESSTMSGWDVAKSTIIQFTGDSDEFVVTMAQDNEGVTATSSESPKNDSSAKSKLADWLRSYIPAKYSGTEVVAHGGGAWFQAKLAEPELIASWAEWKEETLSLKDVEAHGLTEGESIFVDKTAKSDWADHANVTFYDGVGYYIDGYESSTMSGWDVAKSTIIQFTGDSDGFVVAMAKAKADTPSSSPASRQVSFRHWLFEFLPTQYPDARMTDHTYWLQAHVGNGVVANWTEWTDEDSTLKAMEAHNLVPGKSMFIEQKGPKKDWASNPAVTYYEGSGYYISGYDPATMGAWDGKGLSVIQFDGEAKQLSQTIALGWARKHSFSNWLYQYLPLKYPNVRMTDHGKWKQAHVTDGDIASWEKWTVKGVTLKYLEDHSLAQGKSFFIAKGEKSTWADHAAVTFYANAGYYCSGYDSATMGDWGVEGLTVIQFDGDSKTIVEAIVNGWNGSNGIKSPTANSVSTTSGAEPAAGEPYSPFPANVVVTKVKHFENMCWKIAAAGGTWYFENGETSGKTGFNSAFDQAGNDWIGNDADRGHNKSSARGGRHEYRGWPNFGNGNFNHPQRGSDSKSWWVDANGNEVSFDGKLEGEHLVMRSANATYDLEYHFFPTHAAIKVLKAEDKYAFLFEGPIGGEQDASVEKDFYVLKDGKHRECKEGGLGYLNPEFGNNFPSPFFYLEDSDPNDPQVWYAGVKNVGPASAGDEGWRQGSNMVIFSFGRDEDKRAYTGTDAVCVFGFHEKAPHTDISNFIESRLNAPYHAA